MLGIGLGLNFAGRGSRPVSDFGDGTGFDENNYDSGTLIISNGGKTATKIGGGTTGGKHTKPLSGKTQFEFELSVLAGTAAVGIATSDVPNTGFPDGSVGKSVLYRNDGTIWKDGVQVATGYPTYGQGDYVIGAFDAATGEVWFGVNGTFQGSPSAGTGEATTASAGTYRLAVYLYSNTDSVTINDTEAALNTALQPGFTSTNEYILDFTTGMPSQVTAVSTYPSWAKKADSTFETFAANAAKRTTLGLLLEPAASNFFTKSHAVTDGTNETNLTVTTGQTDPAGTTQAHRVAETVTNGQHLAEKGVFLTVPNATQMTFSVYVKRYGTLRNFAIGLSSTSYTHQIRATFNLTDGTLIAAETTIGSTWTITSTAVETLANGWYRVSMTFTTLSTTVRPFMLTVQGTNTYSFAGTTTEGVLLWGGQLEGGSKPSSLFLNDAATSTRTVDNYTTTVPSGVATFRYKFDDDTTQDVAVSPGALTLPTTLNRKQIKRITGLAA